MFEYTYGNSIEEIEEDNNIIKNNNTNLNPIIKWSGGKKDELKHILPHIPSSYSIYLEPFI